MQVTRNELPRVVRVLEKLADSRWRMRSYNALLGAAGGDQALLDGVLGGVKHAVRRRREDGAKLIEAL